MIELTNISKTYTTKSKRKVCALKEVSLHFPEKGLCVIMGQSGCGKTTLLNILGGLDRKFEGTFTFLGKQLRTEKDFAHFRRDYVGFVFQDFNLVEDLTVGENLSVGCTFSKLDTSNEIKQVLQKVGLSNYDDRFPCELSGGEQQRIAIARALLKDCKLLLADEPTGNLDKKTGKEIYSLLKEISKEKLVIIVSHDKELENEFADFSILLEGGKVISQNLSATTSQTQYNEQKRKTISNKIALKMACHEYSRKKSRTVACTLLVVFCFLVLSFAVAVFQYNEADVHYRLIKSQGYDYFYIAPKFGFLINKYQNLGVDCIRADVSTLYFESKQDAESNGIKFYESDKTMELSATTKYLSDDFANYLISKRSTVYANGNYVILDPAKHTPVDLIGTIPQSMDTKAESWVCGGIYYSDSNGLGTDNVVHANVEQYHSAKNCGLICFPSTSFSNKNQNITIESNNKTTIVDELRLTGEIDFDSSYYFVLKENGEVAVYDEPSVSVVAALKSNEVYVSLERYNYLFETNYSLSDLLDVEVKNEDLDCSVKAKSTPDGVGSLLNVNVRNQITEEELALKNLKVTGIIFPVSLSWSASDNAGEVSCDISVDRTWYTNDKDILFQCLRFGSAQKNGGAWIKTDSVKDLKGFLRMVYNDNIENGGDPILTPFTKFENSLMYTVDNIQLTLFVVGIPLIISTILVLNITVSAQIKDRRRELGIFKALGAQNKDLSKIYIFEMVIMALPTLIFAIFGAWGSTLLLNMLVVINYYPQLQVLYYGLINVPITLVVGFVLILIATFVPLAKIKKLNVIEAIRNN